jgi:hypothetical protein
MRRVMVAVLTVSLLSSQAAYAAEPVLIAIGNVSGSYEDFATQTAGVLANNVPGNRLGGIGSGLAYLGDDWTTRSPTSTASIRFTSACRRATQVRRCRSR